MHSAIVFRQDVTSRYQGMEGNGPVNGNPVEHRIALASTDPIALDSVASELMGFSPHEIGYLVYANELGLGQIDLAKIDSVGDVEGFDESKRNYQPHRTYEKQKQWKQES